MRIGAVLLALLLSGCYETRRDPDGHPVGEPPVEPAPDPAPPDPVDPAPPEDPPPPVPPPDDPVEPSPPPDLSACAPQHSGLDLGQYTNGVAYQGGLVFVAYETDDENGGLDVLDVSGAAPVVLGHLDYREPLTSVEILDETRVLVGGRRLSLVDVADPTNPRELGSVPLGDRANAISAADGRALVADGYDGVDIFDVSGPLPLRLSTVPDTWYAWDVELRGTTAFVAAGLYDSDLPGLRILDVHDALAPVEVSWLPVTDAAEVEVDAALDWAFVSDWNGSVHVVDIAQPQFPQILATIAAGEEVRSMALWEDRLVAGGLGVTVIDVSDPFAARAMGTLDLGMWVFDAVVFGDAVYLAGGGLVAFDLACSR